MTSIFISYGHDDGGDFARTLKQDLVDAQFSPVWLDTDMIAPGMDWCVEIEDGLGQADCVLAIMTPGSLRRESICHNEVAFARSRGSRIIPVRIFNSALKPSLLLATLSWLDFSRDYMSALKRLIRTLRGGEELLMAPASWDGGRDAVDAGIDIARYAQRGFTGRRWLFEKVGAWLTDEGQRILLVLGEPGAGKSAVAAQLALREDCVAAHFCRYDYPRSLTSTAFVANLLASLSAKMPGFVDQVPATCREALREDAFTAFRELVVQPAARCPVPEEGLRSLIVVDALDESVSVGDESILSLLAACADDLPGWLRIVVTSRREGGVVSLLQSCEVIEISAKGRDNLEDVAAYTRGNVQGRLAEKIMENAAGNFLCAASMVQDFRKGRLSVDNFEQLSPGIGGYLEGSLRRLFPDPGDFDATARLLLEPLVAAHAPIPEQVLLKATGLADHEFRGVLKRLGAFLDVAGPVSNRIVNLFHKALVDWLRVGEMSYGNIDPAEGSRKLADALLHLPKDDPYRLEWFVPHLLAAGKTDDASEVCLDAEHVALLLEAGLSQTLLRHVQAVGRVVSRNEFTSLEQLLLREGHLLAPGGPAGSAVAALHARCLGNPDLEGLRQGLGQALATRSFIPLGPMPDHPPRALERVLGVHDRTVCTLAWSPDGAWLATGGEDHLVRVWDTESWQLAYTIRENSVILTMAWHPRENLLAVAGWDRTVDVWNLSDKVCVATLGDHRGAVSSIAWHPRGEFLATGSWDRRVRLWNVAVGSQQWLGNTFGGKVAAVAWHPEGDVVAAGGSDGLVRVFRRGQLEHQFAVPAPNAGLVALTWNHDGTRLAVATNNGKVAIWDTTGCVYRLIRQHSAVGVTGIDWGGVSSRLCAGGRDGTIRVWTAGTQGAEVRLARSGGAVNAVAWQPGTNRVASVGPDQRLRIWRTSELGTNVRPAASARDFTCVLWSRDGELLVLGGADRAVRFWHPVQGEQRVIKTTHPLGVKQLCWGPGGDAVVTAGGGPTVETFAYSGDRAEQLEAHVFAPVFSVASEPCSDLTATGHGDGMIRVYRGRNLEWEFRACNHKVERLTYSPDGELLAAQERGDRSIAVYDMVRKSRRCLLGPHQDRVTDVAWGGLGGLLFTAGLDRAIRIWETDHGGPATRPLMHEAPVQAVALHPDGITLVAACADKTLRLWDWSTSEQLAALRLDDLVRVVSFNSKGMLAVAGASHVYFFTVTGEGLIKSGDDECD